MEFSFRVKGPKMFTSSLVAAMGSKSWRLRSDGKGKRGRKGTFQELQVECNLKISLWHAEKP